MKIPLKVEFIAGGRRAIASFLIFMQETLGFQANE